MKKYFWKIFGCAMNYADSERVANILAELGLGRTENLNEADLFLIFSCSVRQKAEDRIFGEIEKLADWKKAKPGREIGLTGCSVRRTSNQDSAKKDPFLRRAPNLDFVWQIEESGHLTELLATRNQEPATRNFFQIEPQRQNQRQVLVPISTGCDNFCSYCVVPYARGREISREPIEILAECEEAVKNGALEITLLGQNVNSYQKKHGAFAKLLDQVAKIKKLKRLRFISSHPKDFDESVIDVMARNPNIERHLHLPAQHGDDEILKKMNRKYSAKHYLELIEKFRAKLPEASATTDFIVGFPGETDEQFENLLNFYRKANFDFAFFAKYSPRPETPAATFENQIPAAVKKERFDRLNALVVETTAKKYKNLKNKTLEVLVEQATRHSRASGNPKKEKVVCEGRSSEFCPTKFEGPEKLIGEMVKVKITKPREVELWGEIAK
ncbi:MAG: tRNA (N6-isopentenyl adenosine(37)-C2)-methylthiotransferase MiaB [Candidatus Peribacteraceae bacterium]|nr:tRNA (N6-isopentenyl adenosine(37)-C2)-methylthiotransferase MiaB [Candidatus Peribacteraceae bacterium]